MADDAAVAFLLRATGARMPEKSTLRRASGEFMPSRGVRRHRRQDFPYVATEFGRGRSCEVLAKIARS
jgi:hypothetical protein